MKQVYFDNAATTPVYPEVINKMTSIMTECYGNPSSIHHRGRRSRAVIEEARKIVANYLNASVSEIFFTSGGTEATNTALKCAVRDLGVTCIISSPIEHHCVLHTLDRLKKTDKIDVKSVKLTAQGRVDLDDLRNLLEQEDRKTLVSLMHANNEIGVLNDLLAIGELCREQNALFHSDTVQTFGHYPIDVTSIPVDFITGSAHKFHGPKGVGVLYINGEQRIESFLDGGSQERNMRAGTENLAGIAGLGEALQMAIMHMAENTTKITSLRDYLKSEIAALDPNIVFHGDPEGNSLYTVLNVGFPPSEYGDLLLLNLDIEGICASGGSACSSGADAGSHVISHLYPDFDGTSIRFSFSEFTTPEEVDFLMTKLRKILNRDQ